MKEIPKWYWKGRLVTIVEVLIVLLLALATWCVAR